ncbi:MAG: hypothetical protein ACYSW6_08880, partial [Planctomycetota bacterium]
DLTQAVKIFEMMFNRKPIFTMFDSEKSFLYEMNMFLSGWGDNEFFDEGPEYSLKNFRERELQKFRIRESEIIKERARGNTYKTIGELHGITGQRTRMVILRTIEKFRESLKNVQLRRFLYA